MGDTGLKLFSRSDLLKGYNVLTTLSEMNYLHGSSFKSTKNELSEKNIAYSNALLNGNEIYCSLYKMDNSAWTRTSLSPWT